MRISSANAPVFALALALIAAPAPAHAHPFDEGLPRTAVVWSEPHNLRAAADGDVVDLRVGVVFLQEQPFRATLRGVTPEFDAAAQLVESARRFGFRFERTLLRLDVAPGETRLFAPPGAWIAIEAAPVAELEDGVLELAFDWGYATGHVVVRLTPTAMAEIGVAGASAAGGKP